MYMYLHVCVWVEVGPTLANVSVRKNKVLMFHINRIFPFEGHIIVLFTGPLRKIINAPI